MSTPYHRLLGPEKVGVLIGIILVANNISFIPGVASIYYLVMLAALIYVFVKSTSVRVSGVMGWLYVACILSLVFNDIPSFFNPYPRFITFFMMTILVSPFIVSDAFTRFRSQAFVTILVLLQYVIAGSVLFRLAGRGYEHGYFQGITGHSMMMGPFAAMSVLFGIYQLLARQHTGKKKIAYYLLILGSLFCLLQAASRTAFIACLLSVMVFLGIYNRKNPGKYIKTVCGAVVLLLLTFPLWGRYMDKLLEKNQGDATELSIDSRKVHWLERVDEFCSSPIIGIGFATVDTSNEEGSTFSDDGKVEAGSSWLCALSMTGIIGFIGLFMVFITSFLKTWKLWHYTPLLSGFLISMQCFWFFHMMAEGYIYAGGSSLFFCVWLLLGVMYGISNNKHFAYELQDKLCR